MRSRSTAYPQRTLAALEKNREVAMPYYLVHFSLAQNYFDAPTEEREALTGQEINHGKKLFKVGIWKHAYTTPGDIKTYSWAISKARNEAELERYLAEYPMDRRGMYARNIYEVTIVDPPWVVGLLYKALRSLGLSKPWTPS
jgi:muconolactone delta-isomerase